MAPKPCRRLRPLKIQVSWSAFANCQCSDAAPSDDLPAPHGWLQRGRPTLALSSPSNAHATALWCRVTRACTLPQELEISSLGFYPALFMSIRHEVEIVPSYLALPSARNEVLCKKTFIGNLNVKI